MKGLAILIGQDIHPKYGQSLVALYWFIVGIHHLVDSINLLSPVVLKCFRIEALDIHMKILLEFLWSSFFLLDSCYCIIHIFEIFLLASTNKTSTSSFLQFSIQILGILFSVFSDGNLKLFSNLSFLGEASTGWKWTTEPFPVSPFRRPRAYAKEISSISSDSLQLIWATACDVRCEAFQMEAALKGSLAHYDAATNDWNRRALSALGPSFWCLANLQLLSPLEIRLVTGSITGSYFLR